MAGYRNKSTIDVYVWSIEGWKATMLLCLIWLAPAVLVALFILRLNMTCGG